MMLWAYISRFHLLLTLGYLFTACNGEARRTRKVVGYSTVDAEGAAQINQYYSLVSDPVFGEPTSDVGANQLGDGYYLVPGPADLQSVPNNKNWSCVVKARIDRLDEVSKVWIPPTYNNRAFWGDRESGELWDNGEKTIARYVTEFGADPDETLRFSYIKGHEPKLQMLIPSTMAYKDSLDFFAKCFENVKELRAYGKGPVNFRQWDVKGDPGK